MDHDGLNGCAAAGFLMSASADTVTAGTLTWSSCSEAEAERVRAFLSATAEAVPDLGERVKLWSVLRNNDALAAVSSGPARLYFTPNDVNLSIETKEETPMIPARDAVSPAASTSGASATSRDDF